MAASRSVRTLTTFLDTSVVVYAYDGADTAKQETARALLAAGGWVVSTQVMQEFFVVVTRKLARPLSEAAAVQALDHLAEAAVTVDAPTVVDAAARSGRHQISFRDALIVAAAARAGCERLLSEDLSHGQAIDGVTVHDPFRSSHARG